MLLQALWGGADYREPRTIDVHVRHLREKLERDPSEPEFILTVRGVGYRFRAVSRVRPQRRRPAQPRAAAGGRDRARRRLPDRRPVAARTARSTRESPTAARGSRPAALAGRRRRRRLDRRVGGDRLRGERGVRVVLLNRLAPAGPVVPHPRLGPLSLGRLAGRSGRHARARRGAPAARARHGRRHDLCRGRGSRCSAAATRCSCARRSSSGASGSSSGACCSRPAWRC